VLFTGVLYKSKRHENGNRSGYHEKIGMGKRLNGYEAYALKDEQMMNI
jgi:hypothetical protein